MSHTNKHTPRTTHLHSLVFLLGLLPLCFFYRSDFTSWGDDYAQYLYQSQQLFQPNDYKVVVNSMDYSPQKRGVFFSLLLALNVSHTLQGYKYLVAFIYIAAMVTLFRYVNRSLPTVPAWLAGWTMAYNYKFLFFMNDLVAEFLFILLLYTLLQLPWTRYKSLFFASALLMACLICTRVVGIVVYPAFLISAYQTREFDFEPHAKKQMLLYHFLLMVGSIFLIQSLIQPGDYGQELPFYRDLFQRLYTIKEQLAQIPHLLTVTGSYVSQEIPGIANKILLLWFLVGILLFLVKRTFRDNTFESLVFLFYGIVLLCWPDHTNTSRYVLPLIPFLFLAAFKGWSHVPAWPEKAWIQNQHLLGAALLVLLGLTIRTSCRPQPGSNALGPFSTEVQEDFAKVKANTRSSDVIAFSKPLLINLCCDRNSFALYDQTVTEAKKTCDYVLVPKTPELGEVFYKQVKIAGILGDTIKLHCFDLIKNTR